jgi:hypothetical protein
MSYKEFADRSPITAHVHEVSSPLGDREFDNSPGFYAYLVSEFRRNPKMGNVTRQFAEIFPSRTNPLITARTLEMMKKPADKIEMLHIIATVSLFRNLLGGFIRPGFDYFLVFHETICFLVHLYGDLPQHVSQQWFLFAARISKHVRAVPPESTPHVYDFCDTFMELGQGQLISIILKNLFSNKALNAAIRFRRIFLYLGTQLSRLPLLELGYEYAVAHPCEIVSITELLAESGKFDLANSNPSETAMLVRYMHLNFDTRNGQPMNFATKWASLVDAFLRVVSSIFDYRLDITSFLDLVIRTAVSPDKLAHLAVTALRALAGHAQDFVNYNVMAKENIYRVYHAMILYVTNSELAQIHESFSQWLEMAPEEYPEDEGLRLNYESYVKRLAEIGIDPCYLFL